MATAAPQAPLTVEELEYYDINAPLLGFMGAAIALIFSNLGAAYGTGKSGMGISALGVGKPELVMKSIVPVRNRHPPPHSLRPLRFSTSARPPAFLLHRASDGESRSLVMAESNAWRTRPPPPPCALPGGALLL